MQPPSLPQIFAKVNLLPVGNDNEKKKIAQKIQTALNFSKSTGNITLVHLIKCIKLIFINI